MNNYKSIKKYLAFIFIIFLQSCSISSVDEIPNIDFVVDRSIFLENELYSIDFTDLSQLGDSIIYSYDISKCVVFKFDNSGKLLFSTRLQNGENEIDMLTMGHLFPVNKDSIFVLENGYGNLALLNDELKIINSWNLTKLTDIGVSTAGSRSQIIDFRVIDSQPIITLAANDNNYYLSDKAYFENTFLAVKINLNTGEYKKLFKYPKESPYRQMFFWGNEVPYFLYHNGKYIVSFPLDPAVYIFTEDSEDYEVIPYTGKLNKIVVGVDFGMNQTEFISNHFVDVHYNMNDYFLIPRSILVNSVSKYFVRVARKAINNKNLDIKDRNIFFASNIQQNYIIQFLDLESVGPYEWKEFKLPDEYRNFIYIDEFGRFYFKRNNNESESYTIDLVNWNSIDF